MSEIPTKYLKLNVPRYHLTGGAYALLLKWPPTQRHYYNIFTQIRKTHKNPGACWSYPGRGRPHLSSSHVHHTHSKVQRSMRNSIVRAKRNVICLDCCVGLLSRPSWGHKFTILLVLYPRVASRVSG